ncbi:MAG: hypothetical protein RIR19_904 [Chloroflexota bacterium]
MRTSVVAIVQWLGPRFVEPQMRVQFPLATPPATLTTLAPARLKLVPSHEPQRVFQSPQCSIGAGDQFAHTEHGGDR